jgi:DNA-binding CsgD family transcriptional regulator
MDNKKTNFKKELAKNFIKHFEKLSYSKKIDEIETIIYETKFKNLTPHRHLTLQEKKCIFLAGKGKSIKETAKILQLSYHTVQEYRASAIKKLGASNITAAAVLGIKYKKDKIFEDTSTSITDNLFDILPACIYWKDLNGTFIGHNSFTLQKMRIFGLSTLVVGKTDYDLFPKVADIYRKNDFEVIRKKIVLAREEPLILANNRQIKQLSIKKPLLDNNTIVGIIGITIDISKVENM